MRAANSRGPLTLRGENSCFPFSTGHSEARVVGTVHPARKRACATIPARSRDSSGIVRVRKVGVGARLTATLPN